jgi:hypothetical protein
MNILQRIMHSRPASARAIWVRPEIYYQLLEIGVLQFEHSYVLLQGLEVRPMSRMNCDFKFSDN